MTCSRLGGRTQWARWTRESKEHSEAYEEEVQASNEHSKIRKNSISREHIQKPSGSELQHLTFYHFLLFSFSSWISDGWMDGWISFSIYRKSAKTSFASAFSPRKRSKQASQVMSSRVEMIFDDIFGSSPPSAASCFHVTCAWSST